MTPRPFDIETISSSFEPSKRKGFPNEYVDQLRTLGLPVDVSDNFLQYHVLTRGTERLGIPHNLHRLPKMDAALKIAASEWIADAILLDEPIDFILVDLDNLKQANDNFLPPRHLGDALLRWFAAQCTQTLQIDHRFNTTLLPYTICFAPGDSPDEIAFAIRGNHNPEAVDQLVEAINSSTAIIRARRKDEQIVNYKLSMSAFGLRSDSSLISGLYDESETILTSRGLNTDDAINWFDRIFGICDVNCKKIKIEKDLRNHKGEIEMMSSAQNIQLLLRLVEDDFANSRISGPLLQVISQLMLVVGARELLMIDAQAGQSILNKLGIEPGELQPIHSVEQIINLFERLYIKVKRDS